MASGPGICQKVGNYAKAAIAARYRASKTNRKFRRSQAAIVEDATKELEALAAHTPDISDADTRKLALRMYYVELAHGISLRDAQTNVGQVFLISPITVQRWATSWEATNRFRTY